MNKYLEKVAGVVLDGIVHGGTFGLIDTKRKYQDAVSSSYEGYLRRLKEVETSAVSAADNQFAGVPNSDAAYSKSIWDAIHSDSDLTSKKKMSDESDAVMHKFNGVSTKASLVPGAALVAAPFLLNKRFGSKR